MSAKKFYKNTRQGPLGFAISKDVEKVIKPQGKIELTDTEVKYICRDKISKTLFTKHMKEVDEEEEVELEFISREDLERKVASLELENEKFKEDLQLSTNNLQGVTKAKEELSERNKVLSAENERLKKHAEELSKAK